MASCLRLPVSTSQLLQEHPQQINKPRSKAGHPRLMARSSGPAVVARRSSSPWPSRSRTWNRTSSAERCSLRPARSRSNSSPYFRRDTRPSTSARPFAMLFTCKHQRTEIVRFGFWTSNSTGVTPGAAPPPAPWQCASPAAAAELDPLLSCCTISRILSDATSSPAPPRARSPCSSPAASDKGQVFLDMPVSNFWRGDPAIKRRMMMRIHSAKRPPQEGAHLLSSRTISL